MSNAQPATHLTRAGADDGVVDRDAPPAPVTRIGTATSRRTPGPRQKWWHLVDPSVDSYKSRFDPMGADLSVHRTNPVWLWGHASSRNALGDAPSPDSVIGRVVDYDVSERGVDVLVQYDEDPDPRALCNRVWDRVERGLIRACSVGAIPTKTKKDPDGTVVFERWSLREGSNVILGGNDKCLVLERDAATAALDGMAAERAAAPARKEVASVAVVNRAGQVLFGKRRDNGLWTTPGGHLEHGEHPLEGARRELREEAGYDLPAERFAHLGSGRPVGQDGGPGEYLVHAYRVELRDGDGAPSSTGDPDAEVSEWRWVDRPRDRNVVLALLGWSGAGGVAELAPAATVVAPVAAGTSSAAVPVGAVPTPPAPAAVAARPYPAAPAERSPPPQSERVELVDLHTGGALLVTRGPVPHARYETTDGAWDADAEERAWRRACSPDGSGDWDKVDRGEYARMFAYVRGDGSQPSDYLLPHHGVRGGRLVTVWRGLVAAAAALDGARGGVSGMSELDRERVREHLAAHYREFGRLPPWGGAERGSLEDQPVDRSWDMRGVDTSLSDATLAELKRGLAWHHDGLAGGGLTAGTVHEAQRLVQERHWWPDKACRARAWFARHGAGEPARERDGQPTPHGVAWALWGGDPGRREVERVCAAMEEQVAEHRVLDHALSSLNGSPASLREAAAAHLRDLAHYQSDPGPARGVYHTTREESRAAGAAHTEKTMADVPTLPQHREMCREAISHHLDGAEMHAQMRDSLPPEQVAHRAVHRDMAMHSLKHADELHRCLRDMHGFEPPADGMVRAAPAFLKTKDEGGDEGSDEMKREFARVCGQVGKLPVTLAGVARSMLGVKDARSARVELSALRDNAAELVNLRRQQGDADARLALQRCDDLIARHSAPGPQCVISPAMEREMRGIDPATGKESGLGRWDENQIRDYVAKRLPGGPVADITRQGSLQPVQPGQGAAPGAQPGWPAGAQLAAPLLPGTQQSATFPGVTHIRSAPVDLVSQELRPDQIPLAVRQYNAEWASKSGGAAAQPQKVKDIYGQEVVRQDANGVPVLSDEAVLGVVRAQQEGALVFSDLTAEVARGFRMAPLNGGR